MSIVLSVKKKRFTAPFVSIGSRPLFQNLSIFIWSRDSRDNDTALPLAEVLVKYNMDYTDYP